MKASDGTVKRTAYNPPPETIDTPSPEIMSEVGESRSMQSSGSTTKKPSVLEQDYSNRHEVVEGPVSGESPFVEEGNGWSVDEGGECNECDYPSCLNPFADRLWVRSEFLSMWGKSPNLQPLATTSTPNTPRREAGVLGLSATRDLFGGENEDLGYFPGARFTLGYKLGRCSESGLEVSYMFLGDTSATYSTNNTETPIIARPFFNTQSNAQDSLIIALPNEQTGNIAIEISNEFNSLEMLWRQSTTLCTGREVGFLAGYRYSHFGETLNIESSSTFVSQVGVIPVGTVSQVSDRFSTQNEFQGGELGISSKRQYCRWSVELLGKVALGNTRSTVDINGSSTIIPPTGAPVTSRGGLLALPTNIVRSEENNFTVIPELGVTLGYDLTCRLKATAGYSFLYWSRVARPSDQLDLNVNPTQLSSGTLSGAPAPLFRYTPGDFWVQGFTLGLDYRF